MTSYQKSINLLNTLRFLTATEGLGEFVLTQHEAEASLVQVATTAIDKGMMYVIIDLNKALVDIRSMHMLKGFLIEFQLSPKTTEIDPAVIKEMTREINDHGQALTDIVLKLRQTTDKDTVGMRRAAKSYINLVSTRLAHYTEIVHKMAGFTKESK